MASGPDSGLSLEVLSLQNREPQTPDRGHKALSPELLGPQDKPSGQK